MAAAKVALQGNTGAPVDKLARIQDLLLNGIGIAFRQVDLGQQVNCMRRLQNIEDLVPKASDVSLLHREDGSVLRQTWPFAKWAI